MRWAKSRRGFASAAAANLRTPALAHECEAKAPPPKQSAHYSKWLPQKWGSPRQRFPSQSMLSGVRVVSKCSCSDAGSRRDLNEEILHRRLDHLAHRVARKGVHNPEQRRDFVDGHELLAPGPQFPELKLFP